MDLFKEAQILAEKPHVLCKDSKPSEDSSFKRKYEYDNSMKNIEIIRDIGKINPEKILSLPDC